MIEWTEYIDNLLSKPDSLDGIILSFDEGKTEVSVPPIVKVSTLMLDQMMENQGKRHIIVFPERQQTSLVFALSRVIHNIFVGKIEMEYNPSSFVPGEKLKLRNSVVEFLGVQEMNGKPYLILHMSNLDKLVAPVSSLPMFQRTNTKRRLSTYEKYVAEKKKIEGQYHGFGINSDQVTTLLEYKTHMSNSVFIVGSVAAMREQMLTMRICKKKVSNLLFMGQTNYEGNITNVGTGQLAGVPAIVISSNLYAVNSALDQGNKAQSVIIDVSNINLILSQLDALDDLLRRKIPVIFVTDTANSFDLEDLYNRNFKIWRWDENSLTTGLYGVVDTISDKRIRHCANQMLEYIKVDGNEISNAAKLLAKHRKESQEQSAQVMKLFEKLSGVSFSILRETVPVSDFECDITLKNLNSCSDLLEIEKIFITEESYFDYKQIIDNYYRIYSHNYALNKNKALCELFQNNKHKKMTLVIPEMTDKKRVENYWKSWIQRHFLDIELTVFFPTEYYGSVNNKSEMTIIVGWLRRAIMRKIIFSYNTENFVVLLYDYEYRWKSFDSKRWSKALKYSDNKETIQKSLSNDQLEISTSRYEVDVPDESVEQGEDELEQINLILRANKYKQFVNGVRRTGEAVEAIPVNFVGGFLAFYQTTHKVISATQIIMRDGEKIEIVLPGDLQVGDFIVVRESGRDIVRDMADLILKNNNKSDLRELASKWREVIQIELLFTTESEFFRRMAEAGCDKSMVTLKKWIEDEDMIAPRNKHDLECIAEVTDSDVLKELLDDVFEAANTVKSAHTQAGRTLSIQLKNQLADVLRNYGNIDPFNFWEPIDMNVEGIGNVKILKIIDLGSVMHLDPSDTNRLIEE